MIWCVTVCHIYHERLDNGARYGQLRYTQGRRVSAIYAMEKTPTEIEVIMATVLEIVKKKMTKPAKNKNTEKCRSVGISSTA